MSIDKIVSEVQNANTKDELFRAARRLQELNNPHSEADPTLLAEISAKIAKHVNAVPAPDFEVPYSMRLIASMVKLLGAKSYVLADSDVWARIVGDTDTKYGFDPVTRISSVFAGYMGDSYGIKFFTDAYYPQEERVLPKNTLIVMSVDGSKGYSVRLI